MKRSFALNLLSSVFLTGVVLSQSISSAEIEARRLALAAQRARTPAELTAEYDKAMRLPPRTRGEALQAVHDKAVSLPMATPGVNRPANIPQAEFDAIARTREFKELSATQQNETLRDLGAAVAARAPGPITAAEVQGALGHHVPAARVAAIAAPVHANIAAVPAAAGAGGGGAGAGAGGGGGGAGAGGGGGGAGAGGGGAAALIAAPAGMNPALYNAIIGPAAGATSVAHKNAIIHAVVAAIAAHGADRVARARAINQAVIANGNHAGYADTIVGIVENAHPIAAGAVVAIPTHMTAAVYNGILAIPATAGDPAFGALPPQMQNELLTRAQIVIELHPQYGPARDHQMQRWLGAVHGFAHGTLLECIIGQVNEHMPVPAVACPALTDLDVMNNTIAMAGPIQPGGAGTPEWEVSMWRRQAPGEGAMVNYVVANPAFNAYVAALTAGAQAPTNFVIRPSNPGGQSVMLTPANTAGGQPFNGAQTADIHKRLQACRYSATAAHGGGNIQMQTIITY